MNFKKNFSILIILFILIFSVGVVSASENSDNLTVEGTNSLSSDSVYQKEEIDLINISQIENIDVLNATDDDEIVVNDWNELQYYCAQTDKDYTLKLKENTNFYPNNSTDINQQIKIKNNVRIIGSESSWIGDSSPEPNRLKFLAMVVEDDLRVGLTVENVTFKWIETGGGNLHDGMFIKIGGKRNSVFKNCQFKFIRDRIGHACIIHLNKGTATFDNCSIINCTNAYGCLSVYNKNGDKTHMIVSNCYFENNYATTEPGCINNCGMLTVYNTTFVKNRSFWWAGAIHTHSHANSTIYDSIFIDNGAGWNGGALYSYSYLQVYNSVFIGNNCTTDNGGGAIGACAYGSNPHIYIENCLFEDNVNNCWQPDSQSDGTGRGGAISIMDWGSLEVRDTTFIANAAAQGTAICAIDANSYGSPDVWIINNSFINHTRVGDVLKITTKDKIIEIHDNYYRGNSIVFSNLTLTKLSEGQEQANFQISASLSHPTWYDDDILDKSLYDVYINDKYVKTVNSTIFSIDFDDLDICDVYVIPTISNRKSNEVTVSSTREYIFVSKKKGNDNNNGVSRDAPVNSVKRALELATNCQNIILLDGDFSESNILIDYDVCIKGEGNATLTGTTSFISNSNLTLKNLKINHLITDIFIKQNTNNLLISNCILTNNDALLVQNNAVTTIFNSILLNNSNIIQGNDAKLEYNWWGNFIPDLNINKYVTLNITADVNALENNQKANVKSVFYLNDGTKYNNLPIINLELTAINGVVNQESASIDSVIVYTLTEFNDGVLTVSYCDFAVNKTFEFLKSTLDISLIVDDVMFGDNLTIDVNLPEDSEGNLTVHVGNMSQSKIVDSSRIIFIFPSLKADTYPISVSYDGDKKYLAKTLISTVNVNKFESTTNLDISTVNVGDDVILTITTDDSATGYITLSINNSTQTLDLNNSKARYVIKNIKRGDYLITAFYNGDDKYLTSHDSKFIEVDNLNATMAIKTDDITYGDIAIIKVDLNDNAKGEIIVTIDGIVNSSSVINGQAEVSFTNLEAGANKNITVFYSGDDTYFNLTKSSTFNIAKSNLTFVIESKDIKIGQVAEIVIKVPAKTSGTFTIGEDVMNIPLFGEISYIIPDLEIGNYSYTAVYNGNNYNTISKITSFKVNEYPIPQWANGAGNTQNTRKSQYETNTNGEIAFNIPFNQTLSGDMVIDSEGNIYLTTQEGIYCFNQTRMLWHFTSTVAMGNLSGIAIGRDVIIAPKSEDTLYFINQTTGERYGDSNIYQGSSLFAPVITSDATLFIASEYQIASEDYKLTIIPYKLWENGGDPTLISIGNTRPLCSPTLNEDIIVIVSENRLRIIDAKTLQIISSKSGNFLPVRPIIGVGNIVYSILTNSIVAYNSNGVQIWKTKVTGGIGNTLAIDSEQAVYHINAKGLLYRYDIVDGSEYKVSDLKVTSGLLIGSDGTLYFGSDNMFYALDSEGNILWKSNLNSKIIGNPVMDNSGLIYVSTENGIVALTQSDLKEPNLKIQVDDIVEGQTATVTVTWNSEATGTVTCNVNGEEVTANADDGKITKSIQGLDIGYYDVEASYSGDMRFKPTSVTKTFVVRSTDDIANNIQFDGNRTFSFSLNNAKGNLTVKINDKTYSKVLSNGNASLTIDDLAPGDYGALVIYSGDNIYNGANRTFSVSVPKFNVTLNEQITTENIVSKITVSLPANASGNLTLSVGTKKYTEKVTKGNAVIIVDDLPAGNYTATLTYSGDSNYESVSKQVSICPTKIPVILDDANVIVESGTEPKVSIKLNPETTGRFTVSVDGVEYSADISEDLVISDLEPGNYTGTLTYSGDKKYDKSSYIISFEVVNATVIENSTNITEDNSTNITWDNSTNPTVENTTVKNNVSIIVSAKDITVGNDAVIDVKSSENSINITVIVNKTEYNMEGSGRLTITDLSVGNYTVIARFAGDDRFNEATNSTAFRVLKVNIPVTDETISIPEGNSTEYSISLPSDATGTFTVTVDGKKYTETLTKGKATVNIPELSEGTHNITVTYSGDGKYEAITKTSVINVPGNSTGIDNSTNTTVDNSTNTTVDNSTNTTVDNSTNTTVVKVDPVLVVTAGDVNVGENAVVNVKTSVETGKLVVNVNKVDHELVVSNGESSLTIPDLAVGNYNVIVRFAGDDRFNEATNSTAFKVLKVNVPITNETISIPESDSTQYSISLPSDATGTLTVTVDGKNYTETLVNGKATVNILELTTGSHNITVKYSGDAKYSPITKSSVVVKEHVPVINLTGSNLKMLYTSGKYFKVRLTIDGQPFASQKVKITINGKTYSRTTNTNGYASMKIKLPPKTYAVKATYGNLTIAKKVTVKSIISAKNINAKRSAKTVKIKVTLKKVNNKYLKNKKITLKFNKKTFKAKTSKKGVATFTIKNSVYKKLKVNKKYTYQVIYGKNKVKKTIKFKK